MLGAMQIFFYAMNSWSNGLKRNSAYRNHIPDQFGHGVREWVQTYDTCGVKGYGVVIHDGFVFRVEYQSHCEHGVLVVY
jgi:hypothetical protein